MERIGEPYRDPRTAYGRAGRIPVGQATELAGMPQEFAKPSSIADPVKTGPVGRAAGLAGGVGQFLGGRGGAAIAAAPEAVDVGRVLAKGGGIGDVATQTAEGIGRTAAASAGAIGGVKLGTMVAPFLGPAAPVAPVIGGIAGGAFGYFAGDRAIRGGREAAGVDPRSPVDRLAAPPLAGSAPAAAPTAGAGRGFVNPPLANPNAPSPAATAPGTILRDGNTYSGQGIDFGADIRTPTGALRNGGAVTSLDTSEGARQDLLELQSNAARAAATPPSIAAGFGGSGGYGLLDNGVRRRRELEMAITSTPSNLTPPRQARAAAESAAKSLGALNDEITQRPSRQAALENSRGIADLGAGTQLRVAGINAGTSRDVARIGADSRTTAAETSANARAAAAEARANTPKFMAIGLPDTLGPNGERMSGGQAVLNAQTGQRVGEPGAAATSQQRVAGETYTDAKGNKAKWDGAKFVPVK